MEEVFHSPRLVRFGTFEVDVDAGELRKSGVSKNLLASRFKCWPSCWSIRAKWLGGRNCRSGYGPTRLWMLTII